MFRNGLMVLRRLLGSRPGGFDPSPDPEAWVREPKRRGPTGRGSAVAVKEPEPDAFLTAIGDSSAARTTRDRGQWRHTC
jgi:hypothetical protein